MLVIVEEETGEVLQRVNKGELLEFSNNATQDYLDSTAHIHMPSFSKIDNKLFKEVKVSNLKMFIAMVSMVNSSDGILRHNHRMANVKTIAKVVSTNNRDFYKTVNELLEQDVLKKVRKGGTTYYCFNPYLCSRGKRVSKELYELFKESRWKRVTTKRTHYKRTEEEKNNSERVS